MCRINTYRVEKDELSHPFLVAENTVEYGYSSITMPEQAVNLANDIFRMKYLAEEMVCMIALDSKGSVLGLFKVSHGTIDGAACSPREIYLRALVAGARSIIIMHNHPSGDSSPSDQDLMVCERLSSASDVMGVKLEDFIIIGDTYYSFRESNDISIL